MSQQASPADHCAGQPLWEHSRVLDSNPMQDSSHTLSLNEFLHALSKFSGDGKLASSENCSQPPCSSQTVTPKYGDAGAMGLAGFALSTFVLSVCNTGQLSSGVSEVVLPVALWYGGFVQLFAGLWEVYLGNTFGATVFSSYGAFWLSYATFIKFVLPDYESALAAGTVSVDDINHAVGLFLLSWLFFSSFMTMAAYKVNRAVFVIFLLLVPTLILLTAGAYSGRNEITKVGGWVGIMCSFSAWYVMASKVINGTWKKIILPLGEEKV